MIKNHQWKNVVPWSYFVSNELFQHYTAKTHHKKTYLFDEVDAGVSKMGDVDRCKGGLEPHFKNKQTNKPKTVELLKNISMYGSRLGFFPHRPQCTITKNSKVAIKILKLFSIRVKRIIWAYRFGKKRRQVLAPFKASQLSAFCPEAIVYCYSELKLRYLKILNYWFF